MFERTADFCDWFSIDPEYRPSNDALAGKFRECAAPVLSAEKTEKAIDLILGLEALDDLTPLWDALAA